MGWQGPLTRAHLDTFNDILDKLGLNSTHPEESLLSVSERARSDPRVMHELMERLEVSEEEAKDLLGDLDGALKRLEELKLQVKAKAALKMLVPVWRCAACGRYTCSFRPYIEKYVEIDLPD
jgi:DNA-directed RNA polymerase subunit N (RpoN/RPB10)